MGSWSWAGWRGALAYLVVGATVPGCIPTPSEVEGPPDDVRSILFVGNSLTYTNDLPAMVEVLLEGSLGEDVYVAVEAYPNFGLVDHWSRGRVQDLLDAGGWDVVVFQQGPSATEGRPSLLEYAERFSPLVRAGGGVTAFYMVWPARERLFDFDGVLDSYRSAAERVDGLFFPAGEAWRIAWNSSPDLQLYGPDGFHPSVLGTYLAAAVMYEQLSGLDARDLPTFSLGEGSGALEEEVVALLHAAAHEANVRHRRDPG